MEIKPLSKEVISRIKSTSSINNLTQCVTELVLNSLDAKSSAVAVRLNTLNFRIQVVDNGIGITKENLEKIALEYSTSKCKSLLDLEKKPKTYGYKGETLFSIANIAKTLVITSKYATSENTFSKSICLRKHEKVTIAKRRQSNGTTVTVDGLFNNLPVRQKRMKKEFEFEEIISFLKSMSIIHPQISITLRDDLTGKLLFKRPKNENVIKSFTDLYPDIKNDETVVIKVQKDKVSIEALLLRDIFLNKPIQHIFVNKRPVQHAKLQAFFCKEITKQSKKKMQPVNGIHPTFVLNIKCSLSKYTITYENSEAKVEFLNIDLIYRCVEKLILNFLGKSEPIVEENKNRGNRKSVCGVSDLGGVVKCFGFKDWLKRKELDNEGTEFIEEVTERSNFGKETVDSKKKYKNSSTKKDKLKSLPIKIFEQNHNKPKNSKENGDNRNKNKYDKNKERDSHEKYISSIQNRNDESTGKIMMENFHRLEINCQDILSKNKHEETLFSNFTNTEKKGKDFLMYMFLKSTEMFNEETSHQQTPQISVENSNGTINNSIETIMESNIFYQNITKTRNHHLSENISVSVTLKRRKNVKNYDEHSLISEKYTFAKPEFKKRKIGYSNKKCRLFSKETKLLKSPYFGVKKRDHNDISKKPCNEKQKRMNFVTGSDMKTDIFFTERFDDNKNFTILNSCISTTNHFDNSRNFNVKKCSDEFSMSNVCFLNFSKKIFCDQNKTYLFNFENVSTNKSHNKKKDFLGDASQNTLAFNTRTYEPLGSFDFKNLPVSPIPKVLTLSKGTPSNVQLEQRLKPALPNFPESSKKTERTWKKYFSEGDFRKTSSPYFVKRENIKKFDEDFSFSQKHFDSPQNNIRKEGLEKIFRRYHTEPLDNSRLQYIQKTKENIDKLFLHLKYKKLQNNEKKDHLFLFNEDNCEVFTRDSLEKDTQIKTPLWKKFIINKSARSKIERKFKGHSHFEIEKNIKTVTQKKSNYFKSGMTPDEDNIGESPDLFSEAKIRSCTKTINDLTFFPNSAISFDIDAIFGDKPDDCKDMRTLTAVGTATVSGIRNSSNLMISLNPEDEKDVMKTAAIFNQNFVEDGWIKNFDQEGKEFYFNERTGITSFLHPKKEDIYLMKPRSEFIPKGLSPIIVPSQQLEKSLSPVSKEKLHDEILKSYKEDLGLVKWEKCIEGYDPNFFFENLYREKLNAYEREVPNIIIGKIPKFSFQMSDDNKFNKTVFKNLSVIGQIDQKFIAAIDKKKDINLIIFDQHAVHERIRLEDLLREYEGKTSSCEKVTLFMKQTDLDLLENHQKYLNGIGIHYIIFGNGITVDKVPSCLLNKISKELPLPKMIQLLVREVLDLVKETRGVLTGLPKMMNQIINMEACRGSVKFGELLTQGEMEQLIEKLSRCNLPFQCAHGRPTLIPLLTLDSKVEENVRKLKLRSLRPTRI